MNNIGRFIECKGNLLIFQLSQSVSEQSTGHLTLVAEQNGDILHLGDSKAKVTISNGKRRWEVGGGRLGEELKERVIILS